MSIVLGLRASSSMTQLHHCRPLKGAALDAEPGKRGEMFSVSVARLRGRRQEPIEEHALSTGSAKPLRQRAPARRHDGHPTRRDSAHRRAAGAQLVTCGPLIAAVRATS